MSGYHDVRLGHESLPGPRDGRPLAHNAGGGGQDDIHARFVGDDNRGHTLARSRCCSRWEVGGLICLVLVLASIWVIGTATSGHVNRTNVTNGTSLL